MCEMRDQLTAVYLAVMYDIWDHSFVPLCDGVLFNAFHHCYRTCQQTTLTQPVLMTCGFLVEYVLRLLHLI